MAKKYAWGNIYLPPAMNGIIMMPGIRGGAEWSGACVDMKTGIMFVGINDIPIIVEAHRKTKNSEPLIRTQEKFFGNTNYLQAAMQRLLLTKLMENSM